MALYYVGQPNQPRELAQRPRVAGPMQPVQPAIGTRGEHLAANRVGPLAIVLRALGRLLGHGPHVAPALPCFSSVPTSENPGEERGRR